MKLGTWRSGPIVAGLSATTLSPSAGAFATRWIFAVSSVMVASVCGHQMGCERQLAGVLVLSLRM